MFKIIFFFLRMLLLLWLGLWLTGRAGLRWVVARMVLGWTDVVEDEYSHLVAGIP